MNYDESSESFATVLTLKTDGFGIHPNYRVMALY